MTGQSRDGDLGIPWAWSGSRGTRGGWARGSRCCICLGEHCREKSPTQLTPHPRRGLAGNTGDARLGGELLAGSHCPVPAHPLRTPREGGGRPSPGAALRSLGVSLAEAPATRLEAPPAPPETGTSGSSPAGTGVPGMTSRCGHLPAEGGCCCPGSIGQLCQDLCWGAAIRSRESPFELPCPELRSLLCRLMLKGRLWAALCPGQA